MEPTTQLSLGARLNRFRPVGSAFCSGALMVFALRHWIDGSTGKIWLPAFFSLAMLLSAIFVQRQLFNGGSK